MEYTTDWILKSPIEDIQDYLKNATIIDLIAVIENVFWSLLNYENNH